MSIVGKEGSSITGLTTSDDNHSVNWVQITYIAVQIDSSSIGLHDPGMNSLAWRR